MTNKEKIRWLKRYLYLERRISIRLDALEKWRSRIGKLTPELSSQPGGGGSIYKAPQFDLINKIVDLQDSVYQEVVTLEQTRSAIQLAIEGLEDEGYRTMMEYRYLQGMSWEWIASVMHYSWRHTHRIHSAALDMIDIGGNDAKKL